MESAELYGVACYWDNLWQEELTRLYGKNAGDVRYTEEGKGKPGSKLRKTYDIRTKAVQDWHASIGLGEAK